MIGFKKHSGIYTLTAEQVLDVPINIAWNFFSSPNNLSKITPPKMKFIITSEDCEKAYQGQIISYKVSPVPFVKTNWITEITQVKAQEYFVDEQRFGPYAMWHHEHWFEKLTNGKTLMKDKISYKIPCGFLGHFVQFFFIKQRLNKIFEYRYITLDKMFNGK